MTQVPTKFSRRQLLRCGAAAFAAPLTVSRAWAADETPVAPSNRLTLGVIGLGSRGFNLIDAFLNCPDAQIVAVCDVDSMHYRDNQWGQGNAYGREPARHKIDRHYGSRQGVAVTSDFRQLCGRDDIDAIVVATPDHWHALCTLEALRGGKDVYCEKPVTHTFHEGQLVYRAAAQQKAIFQTGSQQRSDSRFRRAAELVRNGHIGRVKRVEVGLPPGYDRPQGDSTAQPPPEHLDYDMWTGPAPLLDYMKARHHRWWRGHRAYGGGVLMDWIGHHNDIAHWALGADRLGPTSVEAVNWTFPDTDVYNTPHHYEIRCRYSVGPYAGDTESSLSSRHRTGTKWIGEEGWIFVTRGKLEASDARWTHDDFDPGPEKLYQSDDHARNFLDCVKSRQECIAPAETAHRSITPGHLGYVSQALRRKLTWDAATELVVGDEEANQLLQLHQYRDPWQA